MWEILELLLGLCELVEFANVIALILRGIWAIYTGLIYLAQQLGRVVLEGAWRLLRFGL